MKVSGFNEAVTIAVTQEGKYHPEGYQFLRESLEATLKKRAKSKQKPQTTHVSATELLDGFRVLALKEFGPMAPDIGRMVFLLVEAGAFGRTENDSIDDFERGYDFHEAFVTPFLPAMPENTPLSQANR